MKINLLEVSNDEIKTFYGEQENGNKYIGAGGDYALILYSMSDSKQITGVSLGFKQENDDIYKCDIESVINFCYYFGVCEELLEKFDIEYSSLKMPICEAAIIKTNCEPSEDINEFIDKCHPNDLNLYQDAKRLNYILKSFDDFKEKSKIR